MYIHITLNLRQMEREYLCPNCKGYLRVGQSIVFRIRNPRKKYGLLFLNPELGNYTSHKNPAFEILKDDRIEYFCPLCSANLSSDINENLAHVRLHENGEEFDIYFSRIVGEHSTYKVGEHSFSAAGEDSDKYTHFRFSERFKKYL
jgi:hypothetical protein